MYLSKSGKVQGFLGMLMNNIPIYNYYLKCELYYLVGASLVGELFLNDIQSVY